MTAKACNAGSRHGMTWTMELNRKKQQRHDQTLHSICFQLTQASASQKIVPKAWNWQSKWNLKCKRRSGMQPWWKNKNSFFPANGVRRIEKIEFIDIIFAATMTTENNWPEFIGLSHDSEQLQATITQQRASSNQLTSCCSVRAPHAPIHLELSEIRQPRPWSKAGRTRPDCKETWPVLALRVVG